MVAVMMGVPILVSLFVLHFVLRSFPSHPLISVAMAVVVMFFCMSFCIWRIRKRWQRAADDYLGFFGERYVGECLDILKADGWFVFHDIQFHGATGKFNFDHVTVGPGGVWVVETKTRRKGRARPGFKEHEVVFDGSQIVWPWGEETDCLDQAANNARSMRDWLEKMTGKKFPVAAVVTFPGYKVIERKLGPVRVANPKNLPQVLVSKGTSVLAKADIDLIRRQLEEKCRDVEY